MEMTKEIAERIVYINTEEERIEKLKQEIRDDLKIATWTDICKESTRFLLKSMGAIS